VTESESEDVADEDRIEYITVRHGPQKTRRLWRPVRKLGQGTFSKVYLATSEKRPAKDPLDEGSLDPRKLVAIKVVEHGPAGGADEERVELSLKREVEMLRSVSHPSLVHLKAFDNGDAQALLVLSYCPGGDLFDVASAHADILRVDIVQRIFAELVSAVRYLHDRLIVHRDIKLESTSSLCV
jgi:protein-serine/threonine kinase